MMRVPLLGLDFDPVNRHGNRGSGGAGPRARGLFIEHSAASQ